MSRSRWTTERWHIKSLKAPIVLQTNSNLACGVWAVCLMRSFSISVSSLLAWFIRIRSVPHNLSKSCFKLAHLEINPEWDAIVHVFKDTRNLCNRSSGVVDQFNAAVHSGTLWEGLTSSHCASRSFGSQTSDFLCNHASLDFIWRLSGRLLSMV